MAKQDRGFASMDPEKQRRIASKGGKAAHAKGVAHQFSEAEAREAGRKGGVAPHVRRGRGPKTNPPPRKRNRRPAPIPLVRYCPLCNGIAKKIRLVKAWKYGRPRGRLCCWTCGLPWRGAAEAERGTAGVVERLTKT